MKPLKLKYYYWKIKTKTNIIAESIHFEVQEIQGKNVYIFLSFIFILKKYDTWLFLNEN
jgi:hypothetical protein